MFSRQSDIGQLMKEKAFISPGAKEELYSLAAQLGTLEPLPESRPAAEKAPWRLPDAKEVIGLRGMRVTKEMMERLVREGLLLPDHKVQHLDGPARPAAAYPALQQLFAATYPDFVAKRYYKSEILAAPELAATGDMVRRAIVAGLAGLVVGLLHEVARQAGGWGAEIGQEVPLSVAARLAGGALAGMLSAVAGLSVRSEELAWMTAGIVGAGISVAVGVAVFALDGGESLPVILTEHGGVGFVLGLAAFLAGKSLPSGR